MITKNSLYMMIVNADAEKVQHIIGRALVALFNRQIDAEKADNTTKMTNYRGFAQNDARQGSITAKYYIKHGKLLDWQVQAWTKRNVKGTLRIQKYWRQLDEVAREKAAVRKGRLTFFVP